LKWAALVVAGLFALALEARLVPLMEIRGIVPQLTLALACYLALVNPPARVFAPAWALGLARDLLPGHYLGLHALVFMLAAAGLASIRKALFQEHPVTRIGIFLAAGALGAVIDLVDSGGGLGDAVGAIAATAGYTALVAVPLSYALDRRKNLFTL
jgi:rod shape-determining protein MreD